jgi:DNA polymerase III subunit delta'
VSDPFDAILAQPGPVRVLRHAIANDRVASSYLFEGPSGVGKERAALALASVLTGADRDEVLARRIEHGAHPDVRVFRPRDEGDRNIQVEFLRNEILPFAQFAPFEAPRAVLIFPEADVSFQDQHPESANAILKTLEEPRPRVHFVLLAERPDRLLPTIRSRCQNLRFGRLPSEALREILARHEIPESERDAAVALADGRADRALELSKDGRGAALLEAAIAVDACLADKKPGSILDMSERLVKGESLDLSLETLSTFYRDVAAASLGLPDEALHFRNGAEAIRKRASELGARGAAARVERIRGTLEGFEWNANASIAIDGLLFDLARIS